jgi:ParB-like chromosome segregation protein Spo0J
VAAGHTKPGNTLGTVSHIEDVSHIKDLVADPANRRKHNPRNIGLVVDALHQIGAARSIVIDENNVVLAGNGVTEAAGEAGITKVQVVEVDGDTLVAVRRRGLSEEQKRALAMFDNRAGELAEWNAEQLLEDAQAGLNLQPWFSDKELAALLSVDASEDGDGGPTTIPEAYQVLVTCSSETNQAELLERLTGEGLECRALLS